MAADSPSLITAVTASVGSGTFVDGDLAVIALVKRYASLMEAAQANADEFGELDIEKPSQSMYQRLLRLEARVNVATVAGDLGPKLLAALDALGLSPAARAKVSKGGAPDVGGSRPADALAKLREQRAQRPA